MKPGIRTTEFWLTLIAVLASAVLASGLLPHESVTTKIVGIVGAVLASMGYGAARTHAKTTAEKTQLLFAQQALIHTAASEASRGEVISD